MNRNHYDPAKIYASKIKRITSLLRDIADAEVILENLPQDLVQQLWIKAIANLIQDSSTQNKTKTINKRHFKRSIKKTVLSLRENQEEMIREIESRQQQIDTDSVKREEVIMEKLRIMVNTWERQRISNQSIQTKQQ